MLITSPHVNIKLILNVLIKAGVISDHKLSQLSLQEAFVREVFSEHRGSSQ